MDIDTDTLARGFASGQRHYGTGKFTESECVVMAAGAETELLRRTWCRVFGLDEAATAEVLAYPLPGRAQPSTRRMSADEIENARRLAELSPYRAAGFTPEEFAVIAQEVLLYWSSGAPARRGRDSLPVMNRGGRPTDMNAFLRTIRPWIEACTPAQPANMGAPERLGRALRWWETLVDAVYDSPRLGGHTPGLRGASLQWLAEPVKGENGKLWPRLRAERVLSGFYSASKKDKEAMERAG